MISKDRIPYTLIKLLRWAKRIFYALSTIIIVYLLLTFILSALGTNPKPHQCEVYQSVYITTNGVHLNIIFNSGDLPADLKKQLEVNSVSPYVSFGWGDQGFYLQTPQWKDLKLSVAFKALFMKSKTAMHVIRYPRKFPSWIEVKLCPEQLNSMLIFITNSFKNDNEGQFVKIEVPGYTAFDNFYEAKGSYTLFYTCNNWVNQALKKAGVQTSIWSPLDKGVLYHLRKNQPSI